MSGALFAMTTKKRNVARKSTANRPLKPYENTLTPDFFDEHLNKTVVTACKYDNPQDGLHKQVFKKEDIDTVKHSPKAFTNNLHTIVTNELQSIDASSAKYDFLLNDIEDEGVFTVSNSMYMFYEESMLSPKKSVDSTCDMIDLSRVRNYPTVYPCMKKEIAPVQCYIDLCENEGDSLNSGKQVKRKLSDSSNLDLQINYHKIGRNNSPENLNTVHKTNKVLYAQEESVSDSECVDSVLNINDSEEVNDVTESITIDDDTDDNECMLKVEFALTLGDAEFDMMGSDSFNDKCGLKVDETNVIEPVQKRKNPPNRKRKKNVVKQKAKKKSNKCSKTEVGEEDISISEKQLLLNKELSENESTKTDKRKHDIPLIEETGITEPPIQTETEKNGNVNNPLPTDKIIVGKQVEDNFSGVNSFKLTASGANASVTLFNNTSFVNDDIEVCKKLVTDCKTQQSSPNKKSAPTIEKKCIKSEINEGVLLHLEASKETNIMRDGRILKDKKELLKDIESKIEENVPIEVKDFDIQQSLTEQILLDQVLRLSHQRTSPRRRGLSVSDEKTILKLLETNKRNTRAALSQKNKKSDLSVDSNQSSIVSNYSQAESVDSNINIDSNQSNTQLANEQTQKLKVKKGKKNLIDNKVVDMENISHTFDNFTDDATNLQSRITSTVSGDENRIVSKNRKKKKKKSPISKKKKKLSKSTKKAKSELVATNLINGNNEKLSVGIKLSKLISNPETSKVSDFPEKTVPIILIKKCKIPLELVENLAELKNNNDSFNEEVFKSESEAFNRPTDLVNGIVNDADTKLNETKESDDRIKSQELNEIKGNDDRVTSGELNEIKGSDDRVTSGELNEIKESDDRVTSAVNMKPQTDVSDNIETHQNKDNMILGSQVQPDDEPAESYQNLSDCSLIIDESDCDDKESPSSPDAKTESPLSPDTESPRSPDAETESPCSPDGEMESPRSPDVEIIDITKENVSKEQNTSTGIPFLDESQNVFIPTTNKPLSESHNKVFKSSSDTSTLISHHNPSQEMKRCLLSDNNSPEFKSQTSQNYKVDISTPNPDYYNPALSPVLSRPGSTPVLQLTTPYFPLTASDPLYTYPNLAMPSASCRKAETNGEINSRKQLSSHPCTSPVFGVPQASLHMGQGSVSGQFNEIPHPSKTNEIIDSLANDMPCLTSDYVPRNISTAGTHEENKRIPKQVSPENRVSLLESKQRVQDIPLAIVQRDPRLRNRKMRVLLINDDVPNSDLSVIKQNISCSSGTVSEKDNPITDECHLNSRELQKDADNVQTNEIMRKKAKKREVDEELLYRTPLSDLHDVPERSSYSRSIPKKSKLENKKAHQLHRVVEDDRVGILPAEPYTEGNEDIWNLNNDYFINHPEGGWQGSTYSNIRNDDDGLQHDNRGNDFYPQIYSGDHLQNQHLLEQEKFSRPNYVNQESYSDGYRPSPGNLNHHQNDNCNSNFDRNYTSWDYAHQKLESTYTVEDNKTKSDIVADNNWEDENKVRDFRSNHMPYSRRKPWKGGQYRGCNSNSRGGELFERRNSSRDSGPRRNSSNWQYYDDIVNGPNIRESVDRRYRNFKGAKGRTDWSSRRDYEMYGKKCPRSPR